MIHLTNKNQQITNINKINKIKEINEKIKKHRENSKLLNDYNKLNGYFKLKTSYNSIIPLKLFTSWHTKDLPPLMKQNYDKLKTDNPEFEHYLFDENDCKTFIKNNFDEEVFNAYNHLLPCAYKSDLWRYCVLYINGGIYVDIKFKCSNGFKFISLTEREFFVKDIRPKYIYNALIVTLPKNNKLLNAINQIVLNVKNKYYGENPLFPTGPALLGNYFNEKDFNNFSLYHKFTVIKNVLEEYYIIYNDNIIVRSYKDYRKEQSENQKNEHYDKLWHLNKIYV